MISARLGDVLSELYLLSAVLKRWEDEGRKHDDLPLVHWCLQQGYAEIEKRMDQVLSNLPGRVMAWGLRAAILPLRLAKGPDDALTRECAELLLKPSPTHVRLAADLQRAAADSAQDDDPLALLTRAFAVVDAVQPIRDRLKQSGVRDWREAHRHGAISASQAAQLEEAEAIVSRVLQVDDFAPRDLSPQAAEAEATPGRETAATPAHEPVAKAAAAPAHEPAADAGTDVKPAPTPPADQSS